MKRFLVLTLLVLLTATSADAASRGLSVQLRASEAKNAPVAREVNLYGQSHALVIGIDAYTNGWPRLSNAVKDAKLVAAALRKKGFGVTLKTNLTSTQLKKAFEEFFVFKGQNKEARLFVWYAGHGHTLGGEGYLVPSDAPRSDSDEARFKFSALNMRRFGEFVRQANSKHVFNVFDSCFAGTVFNTQRSLPPAAITHATTQPVRQFLTSGDADQKVSDDGTFRKLFIRALEGGERADANGDGYITGSEMGMFLTDRMTNLSRIKQTPRYGKLAHEDYDRGDFVFKLAAVSKVAPVLTRRTPPVTASNEGIFWNSIKDSKDVADYQDYLAQFPRGTFARLAKRRIEKHRYLTDKELYGVDGNKPQNILFKDCPKCPDMVVIPAGRFQMGDLSGDVYASEKPVHVVTIPKPIAVGKFEVTQAEWRAVMGSNPSGFKGDRNPVERINWNDAEDFVIKLRTKTGKNYRLLSEAEWEYAARAGTTTPFHTGNQITTDQANFNGNSSYNGSSKGLYREKTIAVGSFSANAFGLYDMHGNVEELVDDCWNDNYHGAPVKGEGWSDGDCSRRVVRGGSWAFEPRAARSANRRWSTFESYTTVHGIRIARDLSAEELRAGVTAPSQQVAVVAPQHPNVRQSVLPQGTITFEPFSFY